MKKIFTLIFAALASLGMWAAYTPTADEVIILTDVYDSEASTANYSKHSAVIFYANNASFSSKTAGDPANNGAAKSGVQCLSTKNNGNNKKVTLNFAGCDSIIVYRENNSISRYVLLNGTANETEISLSGTACSSSYLAHGYSLDPNKTYTVTLQGTGTGTDQQDVYVYAVKLFKGETCIDPEAELTISKTTAYVGDTAHFNFTSNSSLYSVTTTLDGEPAELGTDYAIVSSTYVVQPGHNEGDVIALKAGTFVMTFTQEQQAQLSGDPYCAAEKSVTVTVYAKSPVTAVAIEGPTAGIVGQTLTYTATVTNATDYAWFVDGVNANTNADEFTYTAVKGNHTIVCKARNDYNEEDEWIESNPIALSVTNVSGTLVSFTVNSNADGAASISGEFASDATAKVSLTKGSAETLDGYTGYKMDKGKYAGVTLATYPLLEGDTVSFMVTKASGTTKLYLYDDEKGTNRLDSIAFSGQTGWATFVLNQTTKGAYLYRSNPDVKPYDQNPYVAALKIIRAKDVKSTTESLTGAAINDAPLAAADLATLLSSHTLILQDSSYVDAPVVKFTKHLVITYEDESVSERDEVISVTSQQAEATTWGAATTINEIAYSVYTVKKSSFVVHYMDGATELGTENVAANGTVANYAQYQELQLATFEGWYQDVDLIIEAVLTAPITAETYLYAKFTYTYATSINIEQWIIDNGKDSANTVALINLIGSSQYAHNLEYVKGNLELDSLTDKTDRNEPYLGLKVKKSGSMINFRVAEGQDVNVKFGAIKAEKPQVSINGGTYEDMVITDSVYTYNATAEALISIKTASDNAVVFKQIMINEPIQDVDLPKESTGIEDVAAEVKAVKVIREGQVLIIRDGKTYNALGAEVK